MRFTILIPSYNEKEDVRLSIESALAQTYPDTEILVVDDSNDGVSRPIIQEYEDRGVKLVIGPKMGCCGAKNMGMKMATGEVIVILNADVKLPADFLERIKKHYDEGADYVLVEALVLNQENTWARYVEMLHKQTIGPAQEWTEGFSARKSAVEKVGFIPGEFSVTFCRDWFLGKALQDAGFKKVIDRSIVVTHKAPDNLEEYWRVRKARGRFGSLTQALVMKRPFPLLVVRFLVKDIFLLFKFALILPAAFDLARIARHSTHKIRDFFAFIPAYVIQWFSFAIGEWQGFRMAKSYVS